MPLELSPLPFARDSLEPFVSARTLEFHHGKHHKAYVDKTNALIEGTRLAEQRLDEIVRAAKAGGDDALFNNSAQAWNHDFFWQCLSPGGGRPDGDIKALIDRDFGGLDDFKAKFGEAAVDNFASGWTWLCRKGERLEIVNTDDADTPLVDPDRTPLFVVDVWEHAYYLDHQNERKAYVTAILDNLVNWDFVAANLR
jgi:superoxide dismutase, Fe-Mn family